MSIRRALVSVSDKAGLADFARGLVELGVEIVSTGGTARYLSELGLKIVPVSTVTGFPEIMDGRVKTLHPFIHAGILANREVPEHLQAIRELGIAPIDLVVVNLYPFEATVARKGVTEEEAIENIDIGGPTMVRAAAKNFTGVAVVVDPADYAGVLAEMRSNKGELSPETRKRLARTAFNHTASYDAAISTWFNDVEGDFPSELHLGFKKVQSLRYGENPHQRGAFYIDASTSPEALPLIQQLHGAQLSFNNLLDLDAARRVVDEFALPCCVIIKHNNPCGVCVAEHVGVAYERAFSCDPVSAFGGVYALNRVVDAELATEMAKVFIEVVSAPGFEQEALEILTRKPDIRILVDAGRRGSSGYRTDMKKIAGGLLVQDRDLETDERDAMRVVTSRNPTELEWEDLLFGWRVAKHVKSNAIVVVKNLMTVGVGAGQMSRVDSSRIALQKAQHSFEGAAVASDAFFPFPDALEVVADAGVTCAIHPGGSKRDDEVRDVAEARGMAMVMTGRRHFRH
ncbi:MAG: bifunctional phosphoribosylaminoimidazolecarboxamide formyltransferase/IMP cyclohydrolase [Actinobacteria bacterium]|nr:bifunctional phosphoribosylaminoimidazolecarboxamide formyltransferase/IMP cyclohydrolase [Actinomycetota bacterium]